MKDVDPDRKVSEEEARRDLSIHNGTAAGNSETRAKPTPSSGVVSSSTYVPVQTGIGRKLEPEKGLFDGEKTGQELRQRMANNKRFNG